MPTIPAPSPPARSPIEELLAISPVNDEKYDNGTNAFTHTSPLKCPPWARGAYGGHVLAMALLAAYDTVAEELRAHSMHCDFLHAAQVDVQVVYIVHRTRDSNNFASRRVEAKQLGKVIFTAVANFSIVKRTTGRNILHHTVSFPVSDNLLPPPDEVDESFDTQSAAGQGGIGQPCDCIRAYPLGNGHAMNPSERKFYQWMRARGKITGGVQQQLAALAYMTDNYFIGTTFRAHNATRFSSQTEAQFKPDRQREEGRELRAYYDALREEELAGNMGSKKRQQEKQVDWLVTLDHAIYFHDTDDIRADEWMLTEMETPWAGSERGFVMERIWSHTGRLLATCVQQGIVRLHPRPADGRL